MKKRKEDLYLTIDDLQTELVRINDYIHDNPELGHNEFKAVKKLTNFLSDNNFTIESNIAGLQTSFIATFKNKSGGPTIGLICEYDALEELGHGCGHNLQGPSISGAAIALSRCLGEYPATIKVIGTPAEETTSGKIPMDKEGVFDKLDIALMMHGGDRTTVDYKSLATNTEEFVFTGKAAHAAVAPEQGISALDAVLMTFNGIEYLREHVRSDVKMHGIITDGGQAANIVPEHAAAKFSIRAADRKYLDSVVERVFNVARGASLATGAELTINHGKRLESKLNVDSLNSVLLENAKQANVPGITPPRNKTGSTDFSLVTHKVPGACLRVAFVPFGTSNHTKEWVEAGKKKEGHNAVLSGAKAISGAAYDLITNSVLLKQIKEEFKSEKNASNDSTEGDGSI